VSTPPLRYCCILLTALVTLAGLVATALTRTPLAAALRSSRPAEARVTPRASPITPDPQQGYIFRFLPSTGVFSGTFPIPLPGSRPIGVAAVAGTGHQDIWFTLSDANLIGRLIYTDTAHTSFVTYTIPTANSIPLNVTYSGGAVWFTEYAGNRIGRLDPATGVIIEYIVPTANSGPADIGAAPDGTLWFSEQTGNKLGSLNPISGTLTEYSDPGTQSPQQPYGIFVQNDNTIWVTEPNRGWVSRLIPPNGWSPVGIGAGTYPYDLAVDGVGIPWVLERGINGICGIITGTLQGCLYQYPIPAPASAPAAIVIENNTSRWFTESGANQLGHMTGPPNVAFQEYPLPVPGLWPQGLALASDGSLWIAAQPRQQLYQPLIFR